jgi:uncharacterized protein (TIGR02271 family)
LQERNNNFEIILVPVFYLEEKMETKAVENTNMEMQETALQDNQDLNNGARVIPIIHEQVTFDKRVIETGQVRISKRTVEHEELVDVPLFREEVSVERIPINQFVDEAPPVRQEGDTMIISVVEEQVVLQKRLVLVEELRVRKQVVEDHKPQQITLRKEELEITRSAENENQILENRS